MNWKERKTKRRTGRCSGKKNHRFLLLAGAAVVLAAIQLPALTVLSPNGGESWTIGTTVSIRWTPTSAWDNVRIILYRGGRDEANRLGTIVDSVGGVTGSYSWPAGVYDGGRAIAGNDYYVRVKLIGGEDNDFSNSAFNLLGTITVSEPMETAAYEASRSDMRIAWTYGDVSGSVRIDLERQDGAERYVVSDSVAVGGSPVTWPIPLATAEGTYRVRISQGATEGSSGRCHIMAYRPPGLAVLQPNGGEELVMGNSYPIRWLPHYLTGNVRVELLHDGRLAGVLSESTPVGGMCSISWDARTCEGRELVPGRGFKIRVTTLDGLYTDSSDGSFALTPRPSITLYHPNKGETWVADITEEIRWNSMKMEGYNVELHLEYPDPARPSGTGGFIITRSVPATDGHFPWRVGTVLNAGDVFFRPGVKKNCTIFLRATKGGSAYTNRSQPFNIKTLE